MSVDVERFWAKLRLGEDTDLETRGAARDRRRNPPRGRRSARVAAERLHPGRVLRQRQDGNRQLDAQDIRGPLDEQIRGAMRFVIRNRRVAARKQPARTDFPQYSDRAVFEAVVNAVVHRDYAVTGSRIRLFMFDDRLELYSPGGLCNSMKIEDLRTSHAGPSRLLPAPAGSPCPVAPLSKDCPA